MDSKIVDLEYHEPVEECVHIPPSDEMGIAVGTNTFPAQAIFWIVVVLGIIALGVVIFQAIFP